MRWTLRQPSSGSALSRALAVRFFRSDCDGVCEAGRVAPVCGVDAADEGDCEGEHDCAGVVRIVGFTGSVGAGAPDGSAVSLLISLTVPSVLQSHA